MSMERQIQQLCKKLLHLGYYPFQIKNMMHEAIGNIDLREATHSQYTQLISTLEKYLELGHEFVLSYSK